MAGKLALLVALIDVGVPAAEAGEGEPDPLILRDQMRQLRRRSGEAVRRRRTVIGLLHFLREVADQLGTRGPPFSIGPADRVVPGV